MADDNISTSITFKDPEDARKPVTVGGVKILPGETVDLADFMDRGRAEALAKGLAGSTYFQVEGQPDTSAEAEKREQAKREREQAIQLTAERQHQAAMTFPPEGSTEVPDDIDAPDQATLENPSTPRRTRNAPRTAPHNEK